LWKVGGVTPQDAEFSRVLSFLARATRSYYLFAYVLDIERVCAQLADIGPAAAPVYAYLIRSLAEASDATERRAILLALGGIGRATAGSIPLLIGTLNTVEDTEALTLAVLALGKFGERARDAIPALEALRTRVSGRLVRDIGTATEQIGVGEDERLLGSNVARAFRLGELEITSTSNLVGDAVEFRCSLINMSGESLEVPDRIVQQYWIERLGDQKEIPSVPPGARRVGARYASGGSVIHANPRIEAGEHIPLYKKLDTAGFPEGSYRLTLEYRSERIVLESTSIEFELKNRRSRERRNRESRKQPPPVVVGRLSGGVLALPQTPPLAPSGSKDGSRESVPHSQTDVLAASEKSLPALGWTAPASGPPRPRPSDWTGAYLGCTHSSS
jgi:hypothetical protein